MSYRMRQCTGTECRFRYPVRVGEDDRPGCPRCGAPAPLVTDPFAYPDAPAVNNPAGAPVSALLDNVRSAFNVGSMFRVADGAGLSHLHLCGITATPEQAKVAKTALGAEESVPWTYHNNGVDAARRLRAEGYRLWALESARGSESLFAGDEARPGTPIVLVVGNERAGVDPDILARCHCILHIPMQGRKESLNVAIAFGIAAYFLRYHR